MKDKQESYSNKKIEFCAWVLRETWGKRRLPEGYEKDRIQSYCKDKETLLACILRITGIAPFAEITTENYLRTGSTKHDNDKANYYRKESQRVLNRVHCPSVKRTF